MGEGFICRRGGGVSLPDAITAGNTAVNFHYAAYQSSAGADIYAAIKTFTANRAGVYRFFYDVYAFNTYSNSQARLVKNGVEIAASVTVLAGPTPVIKQVDVSCSAGDTVALQVRNNVSGSHPAMGHSFIVSMLAADIQTELNKAGTMT